MTTPAAPPDRYPDAIIVPMPFQGLADPHPAFTRLFRKLFEPKPGVQVYARAIPRDNVYFLTAHPDDTRRFPMGHPAATQPRYDWFLVAKDDRSPWEMPVPVERDTDHPGGVKLGWLRDPGTVQAATPEQQAEVESRYLKGLEGYLPKVKRYRELLLVPADKLTPDQKAELKKHEEYLSK